MSGDTVNFSNALSVSGSGYLVVALSFVQVVVLEGPRCRNVSGARRREVSRCCTSFS